MTSLRRDVDRSQNKFNYAIQRAADPYAGNVSGGQHDSQAEQQEIIELKLQIVKQQKNMDKLSSKLRQCQLDNEAMKAEKSFLRGELALDKEIIDRLRQENDALRQQLRPPEKTSVSGITAQTSRTSDSSDTADVNISITQHSNLSWTPKVGGVDPIGNIANTDEINLIDDTPSIQETYKGFRRDYSLGDTIRSPSHMIIEPTSDRAIRAVESLQDQDFVFVKRSDGSYSYAIMAYRKVDTRARHTKKNEANKKKKECMVFVIDSSGCTKLLHKSHWSESIRLVSVERQDEV